MIELFKFRTMRKEKRFLLNRNIDKNWCTLRHRYIWASHFMLFSFYLFLLVPALLLFLKFMSTFPQVRIFGSCDIVTDYVAFFPPQLFPKYQVRNVKGLLKFKGLLPICNTKVFVKSKCCLFHDRKLIFLRLYKWRS